MSFFNMKLLSSSPSISSSSSTVSFDPKMCSPKSATAGCLAGILRQILCSRSLPTHPSDHITEANSVASNYKNQQLNSVVDKVDASKVSPGIVARLMGLDSFPEIGFVKTQNPNSITRSKSMNLAYYKHDDDPIHGSKHRRVNSTLSFRDMPTYFELENEEFIVLSLAKESERKELRSKGRKCKGGSGEFKKRKEEKNKEKENRMVEKVNEAKKEKNHQEASRRVLNVLNEEKLNRRIVDKPNQEVAKCSDFSFEKPIVSGIKNVDCSKFVDKKGVPDGAKLRKKKKKIQHFAQNVEHQCSSEDSSPVSVLDFDQFIIDHNVPKSDSKAEGSNPRRKLSPELESFGCKSPSNNGNYLIEDNPRVKAAIEGQILESGKEDCHSEINLECWDAICRMIEAEVAKSSWLWSKNEGFEDIAANFESEILDQLLDELLVQFLDVPMKNLNL